MPKEIFASSADNTERQAYTALITAAFGTRKVHELITDLEGMDDAEQELKTGEMVQGVGWPEGKELAALQSVCEDMVRHRDKGVNVEEIGWMRCCEKWTGQEKPE